MDHAQFAPQFVKAGRGYHSSNLNSYEKQGVAHSYSFDADSALYVDCGDQMKYSRMRDVLEKWRLKKQWTVPKFWPHMRIAKVYLHPATKLWLDVEADFRGGRRFPFHKYIPNSIIEYASFKKKFEFQDAVLRAFPSDHCIGSIHLTYEKNNIKVSHLVDANYGEYDKMIKGKCGISKHLLDSDYVCLDASHMYASYLGEEFKENEVLEAIKKFRNNEYDYIMYSFFSPANMFKYIQQICKHFEKDRKDTTIVFLDNKTYEHFFNVKQYTSEKQQRAIRGFKGYKLCNIWGLKDDAAAAKLLDKKDGIPKHSIIFSTTQSDIVAATLPNMYKIYTSYFEASPQAEDEISITTKNHPDQVEVLNFMKFLVKNGKEGQTLIINAASPRLVMNLHRVRDFRDVANLAKRKGKRIIAAHAEGSLSVVG